jgi:hypothetical protein
MIRNIKNTLKSEFQVMDFRDLHLRVGIQIILVLKGIELSQIL